MEIMDEVTRARAEPVVSAGRVAFPRQHSVLFRCRSINL